MREVLPCVVSNFTSFTLNPGSSSSAEHSENTFGCVSRDGTWSWIARGSLLEVFSVQTKERCASYYFGAKCKNSSLSITAIEELNSTLLSFPCLLVGLDSVCDGGLLCIVNVKTSKVISAIHIPYKVTSLEVVSSVGGAVMETFVLNDQLRYMFGIAAVGTEGGNVFLVDLCLDGENYNDETMPSKAAIVGTTVRNLPTKREIATASDQHICIFLNDKNYSCDNFEYRNGGDKVISHFSPADVIVSALKYIRNSAILVVGFNFGGIQLWNLQRLVLQFSLPIPADKQPLVHFAFQEPENDPRNFCYFWSIRGHYQGENYRPENTSIATLYSMAYHKREWIPRYGYFYEKLQNCSRRFEFALTSDPYNPDMDISSHCSRLITCDIISQADLLSRLDIDDPLQNEEWGSAEDLGLCLMAWENWPTTGKKPTSSYLALFDINQWYQAQMPNSLRCNHRGMCSYLGLFSLKEVSKKMDLFSILAVSLVPSSLSRFKSSSIAEESFFPSSLSFKIWCMSTHGILQATYLGIQKQLLSEMSRIGPNILIDPQELFNRCLNSGLLNHLSIASPGKQTTVARQRETLLTLALEHSMIQFLIACVQSWKHIEFIHTGCSTKFMLDWVWKIVTQIKTTIDKLCLPLFDYSGQSLTENSLITLHIFKSRLKYISDVIGAFQNLAGPQTELGQQELQLRKEVVDYISAYLNVLLWLDDCKLLPEHPEGEEYGEDEVAYPVTLFNRSYSYRRSELHKLPSTVSDKDVLLIDGLVDEFGDSLGLMWEKKGGSKIYPPPSIYAALSSYLIEKISLSQKHMLMYYLLLDMAVFLTDRQSHLLEKLSVFCATNNVSLSLNKLTQAFWHLDHQDFETAMNILVDPAVLTSDITAWQHARIIKSLLYQDQPQKSLKYINIRTPPQVTKESIQLHLSVLVANGLIGEAFFYLRQHQNSNQFDELLTHVLFECQQSHNLDSLLRLPLSVSESSAMANYLHACNDPKAPELLIMFHLLRCRPLEASHLNERLFTQVMERSTKYREQASARNALVSGFVDALPEEQKKLAKELAQAFYGLARSEAQAANPAPLSSSVTSHALTSMSRADLLKNVMDKVAAATSRASTSTSTPLSSMSSISTAPFFRPAITPNSRKRKHSTGYITPSLVRQSPSAEAEEVDFTTPRKKARCFDIRSFLLSDKTRKPMETPLHQSLASLLQTPPISRVTPTQASKTMDCSVSHTTPLSILKTKISSQGQFSPSTQEHLYCRTPSVCSENSKGSGMLEIDAELNRRTDMPSRHLRFQEPPLIKHAESSMGSSVSPRRPIHDEEIVPDEALLSSNVEDSDEMVVPLDSLEAFSNPVMKQASQKLTLEPESQNLVLQQEPQNLVLQQEPQNLVLQQEPQNFWLQQEPQSHLLQQEPQSHLLQQEPQSHLLQQKPQSHLLQQEPQSHLLQQESQNLLLQQVSQNHLLQQETQNCVLQQESQNFAFQHESRNFVLENKAAVEVVTIDDDVVFPDEKNCSSRYADSECLSIVASDSSSSNLEVVFDSRTPAISNQEIDICSSADASFVSVGEYIDVNAAFRASDSYRELAGSQQISSSATNQDKTDLANVHADPESLAACSVESENSHSSHTTPEKKEDSPSSSPYMYTRSRSKSFSPSRSASNDTIVSLIPKSVALFTAADLSHKANKEFPENDGGVPVLEAELPLPGFLSETNKEAILCETPNIHQSRSRSKSRSASRSKVPKSESIIKPNSTLPFTITELHQDADVNMEDDSVQIMPIPEADLLFPVVPKEDLCASGAELKPSFYLKTVTTRSGEMPCPTTFNEANPTRIMEIKKLVTQALSLPQEGPVPEYREGGGENKNLDEDNENPVSSHGTLSELKVQEDQPTLSTYPSRRKSPSRRKQVVGPVPEYGEGVESRHSDKDNEKFFSSHDKLLEPELQVQEDQPTISTLPRRRKSPSRRKQGMLPEPEMQVQEDQPTSALSRRRKSPSRMKQVPDDERTVSSDGTLPQPESKVQEDEPTLSRRCKSPSRTKPSPAPDFGEGRGESRPSDKDDEKSVSSGGTLLQPELKVQEDQPTLPRRRKSPSRMKQDPAPDYGAGRVEKENSDKGDEKSVLSGGTLPQPKLKVQEGQSRLPRRCKSPSRVKQSPAPDCGEGRGESGPSGKDDEKSVSSGDTLLQPELKVQEDQPTLPHRCKSPSRTKQVVQKRMEVTYCIQRTASDQHSELMETNETEVKNKTPELKSIRKKKKIRPVKSARKREFAFSPPHTPVNSEVLKALCSTQSPSVSNFVFSPPATRTRNRQKKLNETFSTSMLDSSTTSRKGGEKEAGDEHKISSTVSSPPETSPKLKKVATESRNQRSIKKMEFSFSKPHTPTDSGVLKASSSTPSPSVSNFVFSPPSNRTRNRQRNLNETLETSAMLDSPRISKTGDEGEARDGQKVGSSVPSLPKTSRKLKKKSKSSTITSPQKYINFISPVAVASSTPEMHNNPLSSARRAMTLRKVKKSVKLF